MNATEPPDTADAPAPPSRTAFVPQLDARQRAMLAEMGVRVWSPRAVTADASAAPPVEATPVASPQAVATPRVATANPPGATQPAPEPTPKPQATAPDNADAVQQMDWPTLRSAVQNCRACALCESRHNTVFGAGDTQADWMVVGEAPGEQEDRQGEPFVGVAGQLLDNMLRAVGRSRTAHHGAHHAALEATPPEGSKPQAPQQGVYIANVLKCRPPSNRNPQPAEVAQCRPYLARQVALVQPKIILAMGRFAVQSLLGSSEPIGKLRGRVHQYQGVPVVVTYHPAYLLRTPSDKAKAWEDLCLAMDLLADPTERA